MHKFFKILFFLSIFIICLSVGILLTKQVLNPGGFSDSEQLINNANQSTNQMKLIIFFVDEIEQKTPHLHSVWAVNLYFNEPHQITFIPLTDTSQHNFKKLSRRFFINEKNELSENTLSVFEKYFLTTWDGSIIVDQNAVSYFLSWLTENQIAVTGNSFEVETKFQNVLYLCDFLNNKATPLSNPLDWQNITSGDFITSLSVDEIFQGMQTLTGEMTPKCKFIQNE